MNTLKKFIFAIVTFTLFADCTSAQDEASKDVHKKDASRIVNSGKIRETKPPQFDGDNLIKTLADGSDSIVTTPFVFVARTPESFSQLQKLVNNLSSEKIDFNKTAIVAAFAGTKNTGGFSIDIEKNAGKISVSVAAPPKDAFVTQALTTPYVVALIAIEPEKGLNLDLSADFSSALKKYRVTSGKFGVSGKMTGRQKKFDAGGSIGVLNFDKLFTVMFNLTGKASESQRKLNETVSGALDGDKISFSPVKAGDFIDRPHPFLIADGIFFKEKLSLQFKSGEPVHNVGDVYKGSGKIEAIQIK